MADAGNIETWLAVGRVSERLLIVAAATLSLVLGWHLFKTGVLTDQSASGEVRGVKIVFSKVGPGTFFALFGSAVLIASLMSPLKLDGIGSMSAGPSPISGPLSYANGTGLTPEDIIKSANAVASDARMSDDKRVKAAAKVLGQLKGQIALQFFSQSDVAIYQKQIDLYRTNPTALKPEDRTIVEKVSAKLDAEFEE